MLNELSHEVGEEVMTSLVKKNRVRATATIQAFMTGNPETAAVVLALMCANSMDAAQELFAAMVDEQLLKLLRGSTEEQCGMFMSIMDPPTLVRALQSLLTNPQVEPPPPCSFYLARTTVRSQGSSTTAPRSDNIIQLTF